MVFNYFWNLDIKGILREKLVQILTCGLFLSLSHESNVVKKAHEE